MADEEKPSFSPVRRWAIALNLVVLIAIVFAAVVMLNYLSQDYFLRLNLSSQNKVKLSPRTTSLLHGLTNSIKITLYYDKEDPFYSTISELLEQYRHAGKHVTLRNIDYRRDPGAAQALVAEYPELGKANAKNLVIFDAGNKRIKIVDGNMLVQYVQKQIPNEKELEFTRVPTLFEGERAFTSAVLAITSPKRPRIFFLIGHGEHSIGDEEELRGYSKLGEVLKAESGVDAEPVSLLDTNNATFAECDLLVIAGPRLALAEPELQAVDQYLAQGGRVFALFNALSPADNGLDGLLAKWGVNVTTNVVSDPENHAGEQDIIVSRFSNHPVVNALSGLRLHLIWPRAISKTSAKSPAADAPTVEEVAFSGPRSFIAGPATRNRRAYPLVVAVEKGALKGVIAERGTTRLVVTGDSIFLGNRMIESAANRDFAELAVNWLLDRPQMVEGIGPSPISEYRLVMSNAQLQGAEWVLLGGMPGAILLIGGAVWLRRRS